MKKVQKLKNLEIALILHLKENVNLGNGWHFKIKMAEWEMFDNKQGFHLFDCHFLEADCDIDEIHNKAIKFFHEFIDTLNDIDKMDVAKIVFCGI